MTHPFSADRGDEHQQKVGSSLAESEARIRALLEAAVDGVISIDERGIIQLINAAAQRMFGYSHAELVGRNVRMLMPSQIREEHDHYIHDYLRTGRKNIIGIGREVAGLRKDGSAFPLDLSVAEARHGDERLFVGILRDVTERKRREQELRESQERLQAAVAALESKNEEVQAMAQQLWQAAKLASVGELAASIAHELNNPLATVALRIESVLARTPVDDPRRHALEVIEQETARMGDLVGNLLQFCRRGQEQISTVDVHQELTKSVELVHQHLRHRSIRLERRFADEPLTIYADRQKMRQVFLNLLTNASDAMPQGGTLNLRTATTTLRNGEAAVLIEFSDTGVGIAEEHLDKVMEPFFTTKEEGKGTGLGLAICRRVLTDHQGTLEISSRVGVGTTVRSVWPLRSAANVQHLHGRKPAREG